MRDSKANSAFHPLPEFFLLHVLRPFLNFYLFFLFIFYFLPQRTCPLGFISCLLFLRITGSQLGQGLCVRKKKKKQTCRSSGSQHTLTCQVLAIKRILRFWSQSTTVLSKHCFSLSVSSPPFCSSYLLTTQNAFQTFSVYIFTNQNTFQEF